MKKIIKRALGLTMALILAIPGCMFAEPIEIEGVTDIQLSDAPDIPGDGFDIPDLQLDLDLEGDFGDILLEDMEMPTSVLPGQGDEGGLPTEGEQQPVELELQVEEAQPVSVVFETTPEDTVITVRPAVAGEDPAQEALPPQVDGSYLLLPGQYTYSATAEGYVGIEGAAFEVVEAELPQYIRVVLEPEEVQLEETQPEETQPEETQPEEAPESAPFEQSKTVSDVTVTVRAESGAFPDGATLSVKRVSRDLRNQASEAIEDVRDEDQNVAASYTFDIKVLDGEGNEIQPAPGYDVEVSFALAEVEDENLEANVYHVTDEGNGLTAEKLEAEAEADTVTAITDGFSLYTVEFTYNNLEYVLPGDTAVPMSEILAALNLTGEVTAARVSDKNLFNATLDDGEWIVEALQPFTSTEWMKVTINGVVYKITVTDSQTQKNVNYIDQNGNTQTHDAIVLTAEDKTWTDNNETNGWYVVNDILAVNERITVQGDVKLILANVMTLTAGAGITVSNGNKLSVYAQSKITGAGTLVANSSSGAAIGEYNDSGCGDITIYGGVIRARSSDGVGIGSNNNTTTGSVSINGAINIAATGGNSHPGISSSPVSLTVGDNVYVYQVYDREHPQNNVVIDKIDGDYARAGTMIFNNEEPDKVAELTSQTVYDHAPFYNRNNAVSQWMAKGGTLKLCNKNMELDSTVNQIILKGHDDYALDLNGLGLIYKKDDAAPIITVGSGATLALEDSNATKSNSVQAFDRIYGDSVSKSVKGGFITTSKDKNGGAYLYRAGGAVKVKSGGRFTMDCGTIVGNEGSGVRLAEQNAVFTMSGGSIIGNKASVGSGVYMSTGTFKLCGAPVISDNYASNVYLFTQNKIDISGALAEGASVGVTMQESADPVFTTNYGVKNADVPPDTYFTSDATGKKVLKAWNQEPVEAKLGEHLHEYTCTTNETTVTITCANRDCGHEGDTQYTLGFKMPNPYVYGAVSKPEDLLDAEALAAFNEAYKDTDIVTAEKIKFFKQGSDTMLNSMPIDVGNYKAQLTIKAMDNSGDITISQEYTIAPKDITITGISVMNKTYDGTTSADIAGIPALDGIAYGDALSIDSNNAKASFGDKAAATDKPVTIEGYTLVGDKAKNYNLVQPTGIKATIDKRELLLTWNYDPAEPLVYNGKVQAPTVTARVAKADVASEKRKGLVGDDTCTLAVEGGHKDAGSYTATASSPSNPNYRLPTDASVRQTYIIAKRPVTIEWGSTTLVYNGKAQAPEATATVLKGDSCEVTVSGAQTNAGDNYTATATRLSNMNYRLPTQTDEGYNTLTTTFSIVKKTLELSWGETFFKHDGNSHVPEVKATNLVEGDSCPLTASGAQTEMGTYTATADEPSNTNYKLPEDNTKKFIIGKKQVPLTWGSLMFTYDGEAHAPTVSVDKEDTNGEDCVAVLTIVKLEDQSEQECDAAIDAGTYRATVTSLTNDYVPFPDSALTQEFTIAPRPVTLGWSDTNLTYNRAKQKPVATVANLVGSDTCEVTVSGEQKNASDTSYTATAVKLSNDNYKLPDATQDCQTSYTIARKVAELSWSNTTLTYNGQELKPTATVANKAAGDTCTVTVTGGQTNAGDYIATASRLSNDNYALPADATGSFTINKKTVGLRWGNAVYTYDGQNHLPEATATNLVSGDTCEVTVTGAQKNAGSHTATASELSNPNYALPAGKTCTFTIGKRTVGLTWSGETTFGYDGELHAPTATATDLVSGDTCEVTVTGAQKNAGTYTATANGLSNSNYALPSTKTREYTIGKRAATLEWSDTAKTYNGGYQKPTAAVTNLVPGDSCTVTVSGEQKDAGSYTATATRLSNSNYQLPDAVTHGFTIGQKVIGLSWSKTSLTYDGQEQHPTVRATGLASGDVCIVTVSGGQKNVGSYTATASALSNENYALPEAVTQQYTINPKTIGLTWSDTSFIYDGQRHMPTATATNVCDGDTCTVTVIGAEKDVGRYTATASALSSTNYALPSTKTQSFSIKQRTVDLTWSNTSFTYDGQSHAPTAAATNLATGDTCAVTVTGAATRAGSYTATASALSNANYALPSDKTQAFTIGKKTVGLTWTNTRLTYNGSSQKPTATATGLVGSDTCNVTVTGEQRNVGTGYTATASRLSNSNYALPAAVTQTFAIAPKTVGLTWSNTRLTYNGQPQQPTVRVTGLASGDTCTVTVIGAQTNAGSYTASASALSNTNYVLPATVTQEFTIAQKVVRLTWGTTSFTYDGQSHVPTATATGLISGDTCDVTVTGAATDVGTYTATASTLSNANYALPASTAKSFTIVASATPTVTPGPTETPGSTETPEPTALPTDTIIIAPETITLNKTGTVKLNINKTLTLKAALTPTDAEDELVWTSSKQNVATVDKYGKVRPVARGTTKITATTFNGLSASVKVKVISVPAKKVSIVAKSKTITVGKKLQLKVKLTPTISTDLITWKSSNTKIARVSKAGKVTGIKAGTVIITARTSSGKAAKIKLKVVSARK